MNAGWTLVIATPLRETLGTSHHVDALRHSQSWDQRRNRDSNREGLAHRPIELTRPSCELTQTFIQRKAKLKPRFRSTNRHRNSSRNGHLRTDQGAH